MSEKVKVLMIDDETDLSFMVKINLEEKGDFEVTTLDDSIKAEETARQIQPDVILLDVVMPTRKGPEVVKALRNDPDLKNIPIVIVSGKGEMVYDKGHDEFRWLPNRDLVKKRGELPQGKGAEALSDAYGVDDYLSKPFNTDLLIEVITDVIERAKRRGQKQEEGPDGGMQ